MKFPVIQEPQPPAEKMTMDEYLDFCWFTLKNTDPERLIRQKEAEERIEKAFRVSVEGEWVQG